MPFKEFGLIFFNFDNLDWIDFPNLHYPWLMFGSTFLMEFVQSCKGRQVFITPGWMGHITVFYKVLMFSRMWLSYFALNRTVEDFSVKNECWLTCRLTCYFSKTIARETIRTVLVKNKKGHFPNFSHTSR